MSDDAREALASVVDELYATLVSALAARCDGNEERAKQWIDDGPYLACEAHEAGLVDDLIYSDELPARLAALTNGEASEGSEADAHTLLDSVYLRVSQRRFALEPLVEGRAEIAVVPVLGLIRSSEHSARPLVSLLRRLASSPSVRAVVLRVNSPGGDPLASDLIWRAVEVLRRKKPVVASLSDTAASGGYYVAMGANEIIAEPTTLTGSIGVVMAALEFEDLLSELGVNFDGVRRGRHASIYDPYRRRSDEDRAVLERHVRGLYRGFVEKAARGRGCEVEALEKVAEGRVWTGAQAVQQGLVDSLGGLDTAVERATALAGLAPGSGEPVVWTTQVPLWQRLRPAEALGTGAALELLFRSQLWCPLQIPLR
jgi:protease-4